MIAQCVWSSGGGKPHDFKRFWPIEEQETEAPKLTKEEYDKLMSRYKSRK